MKFFIVFACALAAASAGHIVSPLVYGAQHLPVIGPNGVPVDTAEVQHARAAHLVHKIDAHARNGDLAIAHAPIVAHAAPIVSHAAPIVAHHAAPVVSAYSSSVVAAHTAPIVAHHASPVVSAYSGSVVAAHASPIVAQHVSPIVSAYSGSVVSAHGPAAWPTTAVLPTSVNGVPLETPEVAAARVNHYAAHNEALARNVHSVHYIKRRGIIAAAPIHYAAQHLPIIGANGVPVDTAEVQIARAQHLVHKVNAHARNGDLAIAAPIVAAPWLAQAAPVVASTYSHSPLVASTYAHHAAPLVASAYTHGSPVVASGLW